MRLLYLACLGMLLSYTSLCFAQNPSQSFKKPILNTCILPDNVPYMALSAINFTQLPYNSSFIKNKKVKELALDTYQATNNSLTFNGEEGMADIQKREIIRFNVDGYPIAYYQILPKKDKQGNVNITDTTERMTLVYRGVGQVEEIVSKRYQDEKLQSTQSYRFSYSNGKLSERVEYIDEQPTGNKVSYTYDANGRVQSRLFTEEGAAAASHLSFYEKITAEDLALIGPEARSGQLHIHMHYDELELKSYKIGSSGRQEDQTTFTYTGRGLPHEIRVNPDGTDPNYQLTEYTYDKNENVTEYAFSKKNQGTRKVAFQYDEAGEFVTHHLDMQGGSILSKTRYQFQ